MQLIGYMKWQNRGTYSQIAALSKWIGQFFWSLKNIKFYVNKRSILTYVREKLPLSRFRFQLISSILFEILVKSELSARLY